MVLDKTPRSNQLHIGIFGKCNSGKSTLINTITNHNVALVSDVAGTTTDLVYKTMEINGIGPCVIIDTAGFDDTSELGEIRLTKTKLAMKQTDIALIICSDINVEEEISWLKQFEAQKTPVIILINKTDILNNTDEIINQIKPFYQDKILLVSAKEDIGIKAISNEIMARLPNDYDAKDIVGTLVKADDVILLVMPQDIQAPKGRLILPQVQTLRELLDKKCIVISCTTDKLDQALNSLKKAPTLIITDSQVFKTVYDKKPKESKLTSFSVLFAGYKGDLSYYKESVYAIEQLTKDSHVLIAEACTHAPLEEDIGRVKIPAMLRKKIDSNLNIELVSGTDFPKDLSKYDLIIQCGACMFNRKYVLNRVDQAKKQSVKMTNYGIVMAYLSGILDKIDC